MNQLSSPYVKLNDGPDARRKLDHVVATANLQAGREPRFYEAEGHKLLAIQDEGTPDLEPALAEFLIGYQQHMREVAQNDIGHKCFYLAAQAVQEGVATGVAWASNGVDVTTYGWLAHAVSVVATPDRCIGVDFTAEANISHNVEPVTVLAVVASTPEELCTRLGETYGGVWGLMNPETISTVHREGIETHAIEPIMGQTE